MARDTDNDILDRMIEDLDRLARETKDPDEKAKYYDRLLKALAMRQKGTIGKKGRGFDLK